MAIKQAQNIVVGDTIGFDDGESDELDEYLILEVVSGRTEHWNKPFTTLRYQSIEDGRLGEYTSHPEIELLVTKPLEGN